MDRSVEHPELTGLWGSTSAPRGVILDVRTVGVPVVDQLRALGFYVDVLGFEVRHDVPIGEVGRWIEVAPPGSRTSLALVAASDDTPVRVDTRVRFTVADATSAHRSLTIAGASTDELLRGPPTPLMFSFTDPDGNRFYIVEELAQAASSYDKATEQGAP